MQCFVSRIWCVVGVLLLNEWCSSWLVNRGGRSEQAASSLPPSAHSSATSQDHHHHQQQQQQQHQRRRGSWIKQRPPRCYSPDGRRFTVSGRYVTWLDWQFYFNIRTTTGPIFNDIRFRGERIVYELALQVNKTRHCRCALQVMHSFWWAVSGQVSQSVIGQSEALMTRDAQQRVAWRMDVRTTEITCTYRQAAWEIRSAETDLIVIYTYRKNTKHYFSVFAHFCIHIINNSKRDRQTDRRCLSVCLYICLSSSK